MKSFGIILDGKPTPKQRPRHGGGKTYTPTKTKAAESEIAHVAQWARPKDWPLSKSTRYRLEVRAVYSDRRHGDLDNIVKLVSDGLNGIAFPDDRQVAELHAVRGFGDDPQTEARITAIDETLIGAGVYARVAGIRRALALLDDDNLDRGDGMSVDTMLAAIRQAREVLEAAI